MTTPDFSDLTPPHDLVAEWAKPRRQRYSLAQDIADHAARWGAQYAAEQLAGCWPDPITDRPPTEADADGLQCVQVFAGHGWVLRDWSMAANLELPWLHTPQWKPLIPQALADLAEIENRAQGADQMGKGHLLALTDRIRRALIREAQS